MLSYFNSPTTNEEMLRSDKEEKEIIERVGIDFSKEINTIVESVHEYIKEYDWKRFIQDVNSDNYKVEKGSDYHAHRIYCTVYIMYSQDIQFNPNIFLDLKPMLISYFEELEEYEKCDKLMKLTYADTDYEPPYAILVDKG